MSANEWLQHRVVDNGIEYYTFTSQKQIIMVDDRLNLSLTLVNNDDITNKSHPTKVWELRQ